MPMSDDNNDLHFTLPYEPCPNVLVSLYFPTISTVGNLNLGLFPPYLSLHMARSTFFISFLSLSILCIFSSQL